MMNDTATHLGFCQPSTVCLADTSLLSPPLPEPLAVTKSASKEEKKPVKKRKSWGQELPVPKTNLPPRKRAKTDDEKEQRRIERVLRNRQAAQSSRERKRQEVEKLEGERDVIHQQNHLLRQRLLQVEEEKFKLKQEVMEMRALMGKQTGAELTPSATPSPILRSEMFHEKPGAKLELDALSLFPDDDDVSAPTPEEEPLPTPLDLSSTATTLDMTQHPAAVLCDLQCQSLVASPLVSPAALVSDVNPLDRAQALATQRLFLTIHLSIFSAAVTPLCQLLASLKKGSRLRTPTVTPMLFTLILWLISTPRSPLQAASPTSSTLAPSMSPPPATRTPSTSSPSTTRSSTFRTSLLRRFLTCSPALARPLKDATAAALRAKARDALRESSDVPCRAMAAIGSEVVSGSSGATRAASRAEVWRLMAMILVIDQWEKDRVKAGKPLA